MAEVLKVDYEKPLPQEEVYLDKEGLASNLREHGIDLSELELDALFQSLKIDQNIDKLSRIDLYAKGHLFQIGDPATRDGRWLGSVVRSERHLNSALRKIAL